MQIAQIIGGYTLGGADLLRRAMGKKKPEEMARQRDIFVAGAQKNGLAKRKASELFDLMEKFAGYGFNKSHAAAYALRHLPDGVAEGAPPGGVHGGEPVGGHGQHRQGAAPFHDDARGERARDAAARRQRRPSTASCRWTRRPSATASAR